ncbi:uncharacterized protein G2W53_016360 [Senna tora]|uniref:Uncharacterized protein n=1 Tax=Senna tora TaxID=362788 RepID=A0A834TQP6_9FABA|nr:uncharacterized protein G2W53_016360 [Senna tora]
MSFMTSSNCMLCALVFTAIAAGGAIIPEQGTKRMIGHAKERNGYIISILTSSQKDQAILEYSPFPELPVLCPQIIDPALQPQQTSDPSQISPDPDLNLQTNQTLDSARPLQVYSRRKAPPPTSEPVQSSPSEPQDVEVIDSSSPHT